MADFSPDWVSPPGDTIKAVMKDRNISKEKLAILLYLNRDDLDMLLCGELPIDQAMAMNLALACGSTPRFWLKREKTYRSGEPTT